MRCVVMPKHCDLDFPHAPVWCDDCRTESREYDVLFEMRRANDLKQRELDFREFDGAWIQSSPRPRPFYVVPPKTEQPKGGQFVDPIRNDQSA